MNDKLNQKYYYITTPIYYVNDVPHIGHSYTCIATDIIARYKRLSGFEVLFLTGTDEHGIKIEEAAKKVNKSPQEFVDDIVVRFKELKEILNLSNNDFIRTTEKRHVDFVQNMYLKLYEKGFIYESFYEGLYCKGCEDYFTQKDLIDGKCPIHKTEPIVIKEKGYFFKLSSFRQQLIKIYENNPHLIKPKGKVIEVLNRLKNEELRDLYISRKDFNWGIPLPWNQEYVFWVWTEALFNYLSALDGINSQKFNQFWPVDVHLIGKDILWFHTVIWHALLLALDLPLPKLVFAHGWWTISGQKMSKTLGNVVYPSDIVKKYGTDVFRFTLMKEMSFGSDGDFSEDRLIQCQNTDLADNLGNLVNRTLVMTKKYCDGIIPTPHGQEAIDLELIEKKDSVINNYILYMDDFKFNLVLSDIWSLLDKANYYINKTEPWNLYKVAKIDRVETIIYNLNEIIRIVGILIYPFIPNTAEKIESIYDYKIMNLKNVNVGVLKPKFKLLQDNLILFNKIKLDNM